MATTGTSGTGAVAPPRGLFTQVARVMKINNFTVITSEVIETTRGTLVIGQDAT